MAKKSCLCCDTKYDFCPNCGSGRRAPAWKATFCSESCKDLWHTLSRFSMNFITKSEASEKIASLELKDASEYVACVQRDLSKVMAPEPKKRKSKAPVIEETITSSTIVETPAESPEVHEVVQEVVITTTE